MIKKKHADWFREDLGTLMQLLSEKKVRPQLAQQLPLKEAMRGHQLLESAAKSRKGLPPKGPFCRGARRRSWVKWCSAVPMY
jgi:hypothetical protein